jgi:membrane-bound inhibitor of C-type lysozyme
MNRRRTTVIFGAALAAGVVAGCASVQAQTFQTYRCADRTQFIAGFFDHDKRAYLQIDGRAVTLGRRLAVSGASYSGSGVSLKIGKAGVALRHAKRPVTACEVM